MLLIWDSRVTARKKVHFKWVTDFDCTNLGIKSGQVAAQFSLIKLSGNLNSYGMYIMVTTGLTWWRHGMEKFSALLAICAGNSPVPGEFPAQRPVTRSFDVFFDLHTNRRLSKQWWGWWFETLSCPLWRHRNGHFPSSLIIFNYVDLRQLFLNL